MFLTNLNKELSYFNGVQESIKAWAFSSVGADLSVNSG